MSKFNQISNVGIDKQVNAINDYLYNKVKEAYPNITHNAYARCYHIENKNKYFNGKEYIEAYPNDKLDATSFFVTNGEAIAVNRSTFRANVELHFYCNLSVLSTINRSDEQLHTEIVHILQRAGNDINITNYSYGLVNNSRDDYKLDIHPKHYFIVKFELLYKLLKTC